MKLTETRPAQLAGTWYTGNPEALQQEITNYINNASNPPISQEIIGLLVPHAGHRFSGPVAGYAYQAVQGQSYESVVVVSPFHRGHNQPIITTAHVSYQTPLGEVAVDFPHLEALENLLNEHYQHKLSQIAYDQEHAVEIQLPFMQLALKDNFQLLPLMLAGGHTEAAIQLGEALGKILAGSKTLLVASTDLSHFYAEEKANQLDQTMLDAIATFDVDQVIGAHSRGKGQACGLLAVVAVMTAVRILGGTQAQILNYATSGATSGDFSRVVGYGAGVFTRE
jgi:AmmeMemoRadiSam system protein B